MRNVRLMNGWQKQISITNQTKLKKHSAVLVIGLHLSFSSHMGVDVWDLTTMQQHGLLKFNMALIDE